VVIAALFWPHAGPPALQARPSPIVVTLVELPKPELPAPPGPSAPPGPLNAPKVKAGGSQNAVQLSPPHPAAPALAVDTTPAPDTSDLLSDSQLAGLTSADDEGASTEDGGGSGGGGGGCDTARIVQQALQRDPLVRTAVENAHRLGKAVMLWNGDWVRSGEQDGKGLSAVREAIIWELAFAPEACRNNRVHGLVLLSLADGSTRFAIGSGDWRWSDLLGLHGVPSDR
jgi:hypothetical protein